MLFGQDGALPIMPIYWYTFPNLEKLSVKDTFFISPLDQIDFTKVVVHGLVRHFSKKTRNRRGARAPRRLTLVAK